MSGSDTTRKYTPEEKQQLLANLELEVTHRTRQLEAWLADALQNFLIHQEGHISRIPKPVRGITMREFQKYDGDVQAALRGLQQAKLGGGPFGGEMDKNTRKRKWVANQEVEAQASGSGSADIDAEPSKAAKNARLGEGTPGKKPGSSTGPGTAQRTRLLAANRTPGTTRTMGRIPSVVLSPSPRKFKQAIGSLPRPVSPSKHAAPNQFPKPRPPSSATFNPILPPKTPVYPARLPRLNESMLSVNGSPITNPYELGISWFHGANGSVENGDDHGDEGNGNGKQGKGKGKDKSVKRVNNIFIRRDPSTTAGSTNGFHSRTNSQTSVVSTAHSRTNSQTQSSNPPPSHLPQSNSTTTDSLRSLPGSALVAIPTKDGHLLEFDPLTTSPRALDALEGITNSSKKQAREDMSRLAQAAVNKWKIS